MGRWGLEGMSSFQQKSVSMKERTKSAVQESIMASSGSSGVEKVLP